MAYETEELWFDEWEHGGHAYYEAPAEFEKWNPVNYVTDVADPAAGHHQREGFPHSLYPGDRRLHRAPAAQYPSKLLIFPDENHWVLKPKNSVQWYDEVFGWFHRYLGGQQPPPVVTVTPVAPSKPERGA